MNAEGNDWDEAMANIEHARAGGHRTVLHADESFRDLDSGNFWVVAITEDEPGYSIVSWWPALEDAKLQAERYNAHLGLADDEVRAIRASSLRASFRAIEEEK